MAETNKSTFERAIDAIVPLAITDAARSHIHVMLILALVSDIIGCGYASAATAPTTAIFGELSRFQNRRDVSHRKMPEIVSGVVGHEFNVSTDRVNATEGHAPDPTPDANLTAPPVWHSTLCMEQWGMPVLQEEPDSNGYLIYVNGREQLSGVRYLVSDGLFVAKALNRTFVEYPVKNSRVASFDSELGLGAYWDVSLLCSFHRILDLGAFRSMISEGLIPADEFLTLQSASRELFMRDIGSEEQIQRYFEGYRGSKVIVLEYTWRTYFNREPLKNVRPNPFYMDVVQALLGEQEDWANGNFMAVQWRTETSTGDLMECYEELREKVEEHRSTLGFGVHQVMFNTDFYGNASGTYFTSNAQAGRGGFEILNLFPYMFRASTKVEEKTRQGSLAKDDLNSIEEERGKGVVAQIVQDYPNAFGNKVHDFVEGIEDTGIKAFVTGIAAASSKMMIASSYKVQVSPSSSQPEVTRCQKSTSGYVHLIVDWREKILKKDRGSVVRAFSVDSDAGIAETVTANGTRKIVVGLQPTLPSGGGNTSRVLMARPKSPWLIVLFQHREEE